MDYSKSIYDSDGVVNKCLSMPKVYNETCNDLFIECTLNGLHKEYMEIEKINHASFERVKRLKDRVSTMLSNDNGAVFLTLTFNDGSLSNFTAKQRRVAVSRFLKQCECMYVANIDFGKKNHREHYHCLVNTSFIATNLLKDWSCNFGGCKAEIVKNKDLGLDTIKLSKYISKLVNHSIKETTRRSALIYSR